MLRSTGCFRSVICPFSARGSCQRSYCHFKHDGKPAETVPRPQDSGKILAYVDHVYKLSDADVPTTLVANALEQHWDQPLLPEAACTVLELEKVSKAIEVVKTEVEQQQHKLLMYKSSLECENRNSVTSISSKFSCASSSTSVVNFLASKTPNPTIVFECEAQDTLLNSVVCNPPTISSHSLSEHTFSALAAINEEDAFQYIPMASSNIKNACSDLNKYVIDRCRPSTDLEYDPLVNYSSNLKQNIKKENMGQQEFKRMIVESPEKKYSLATKTAKNSQPFEAEVSSDDDELVIDVPELPPITQNSQLNRRCQRKGNDANASNLSLIRKVKRPRVADSTDPMLDVGKSVDNSAAKNLMPESSEENELNSGALQSEKKHYSSQSSKSCIVTNDQMNKVGKHLDVPKHGSKAKGKEEPLKLELVKKGNAAAHVNANTVKLSNQKCRTVCVPAKLEVDLQKCERTEERSLIHLDSLKKLNDKRPLAENRNALLKVDQVPSSAIKCNRPGTANESKCISKLGTGLGTNQQGPKIQNQADHCGNENQAESLQTTSDIGEESSLSDEELNSIASEELDFSESDPMEECLRIFNESSKQEIEDRETDIEQSTVAKTYENIQDSGNAESANMRQKKRIAHVAKFNKGRSRSNRIIIPHALPPPKQSCHSRIKQVQQQAVQLMANVKSAQAYKATISNCPGRKRLIAQGSKPQPVSAAKAASLNSTRQGPGALSSPSCNVSSEEQIVSSSTSKSTHPVLTLGSTNHVPAAQRTNSKRGSKVSNNVRKQYLGFFIEEFLKTCSSRQEAIKKALSEEKVIFERSTSRFMYLNVAVQALKMLRNPANRGSLVSDGHISVKRRPSSGTVLEGAALYNVLKDYVLTEGQLKENGYPRYSPDKPGTALLFNGETKKYIADSAEFVFQLVQPISVNEEIAKINSPCAVALIQVCCRCGRSFSVTPEGSYISKEECNHHSGRVIKRQVQGGWEARYNCCGGSFGSVGCQVAKLHVYNQKNLDGFVKSFLKLLPLDGNPGVYAVNSEMCYTKQGGELARVSVVSANLEVVYDVFVKPDNEVIDYNTRFSGVTREDLMNAKTTLSEVQAALLTMLSADTILIGHSLDKDLLMFKLIHSMVIDTSVVFPHCLGLPHKRALRNLMADYLGHCIPDNVESSESVEKGRACMKLMKWKVKEDGKGRKW